MSKGGVHVPNYVRLLAVVLALVFCVSIIDDDLLLQSSAPTGLGKSQLKNSSSINEWTPALPSWSLNASSWNNWIPFNTSLTDWTGWWGDNDDSDGFNMNKSSMFQWLPTQFNSSFTDWTGLRGDKDDSDAEWGANKSSMFPWLPTQVKPMVSIVIDFSAAGNVSKQENANWMSRLTFAKMLQLEARKRHRVETELIIVGSVPWKK